MSPLKIIKKYGQRRFGFANVNYLLFRYLTRHRFLNNKNYLSFLFNIYKAESVAKSSR